MAYFIVGVVRDVLRHVAIKIAERGHVGGIASLHPSEFVVLLPQISFDEFCGRREPEKRSVTFRKLT